MSTRKEILDNLYLDIKDPVEREKCINNFITLYVESKTRELIALANEFDRVVTIENKPLLPLRTGNTQMVADVRIKRGKY